MKKILMVLLTVVLVGSSVLYWQQYNAISALANETDSQMVDSFGVIPDFEAPNEEDLASEASFETDEVGEQSGQQEAEQDLQTLPDVTQEADETPGQADEQSQGPVDDQTAYQAEESSDDQAEAQASDEENTQDAEELPYWVIDTGYSELIREYEVLAASADGYRVITGATLSITAAGANMQSVIKAPNYARVLSNGMAAPEYADGTAVLLTNREGYPQAPTSSDRSLLCLIETREGELVYEATFFFGSAAYPDAPFTAFRTHVVLEDEHASGDLSSEGPDGRPDSESLGRSGDEPGEELSGDYLGKTASEQSSAAIMPHSLSPLEDTWPKKPYTTFLASYHAAYFSGDLDANILDAALTITEIHEDGRVSGIVTSNTYAIGSVTGQARVLTEARPAVGQTSQGAYLLRSGGAYSATFLFGDIELGGTTGAAVGELTVTLTPLGLTGSFIPPEPRPITENPNQGGLIDLASVDPNSLYVGQSFTTTLSWVGNWNGSMSNGWFTAIAYWGDIYLEFPIACVNPGIPGPEALSYRGVPLHCTITSINRLTGMVYLSATASGPRAGTQSLAAHSIPIQFRFLGEIRLIKSSANPSVTNNNSYYNLAGARYGLYRSSSDASTDTGRIHTFTTTSTGSSNSATGIQNGTYYIKELTAPPGYLLDNTIYTVNHNSTLATVRVTDQYEKVGDISLVKSSSKPSVTNNNSYYDLRGAEYGLYKTRADASANTGRIHLFVTNSAGNSTPIRNILQGTYYIKELKAPKGYLLDTTIYTVNHNTTHTTIRRTDVPEEVGDISLVKRSSNPSFTNGNNYFNLAGAQYGLYKTRANATNNTSRIHTFITDSTGNGGSVKNLQQGTYYVKELKAPQGYLLDNTIYTVSHNSMHTIVRTIDQHEKIGDITLIKSSAKPSITNGNSYFDLAGAKYGLYKTRANATADTGRIHTFITDSAGNSSTAKNLLQGTYFVRELTPPKGYLLDNTIYTVNHNSIHTTIKRTDEPEKIGDISLIKSSANPSITDGNNCYDLAGAEYGLYKTLANATADTGRIHTFITDSAGNSNPAKNLLQGTYFVKELVAPKGYKLDDEIYTVRHNSQHTTVEREDEPFFDPPEMIVQKLDTLTGEAYGQDDPNGFLLAGAKFVVRYWDGYYDTIKEAEASGSPTRTWVFATKKNGVAYFESSYFSSGDAFYYNLFGTPIIPLGTVAIHEQSPPPGYRLPNPNPVTVQQIKVSGDSLDAVTRLNAVIVKEEPNDVKVLKKDVVTGKPIPNTEFTLYKESKPGAGDWKVVTTHITDKSGKCLFSPLEVGSYKLDETRPNPAYVGLDEMGDTARYFSVDPNSTNEVQVFENELIKVSIEVYKKTIPLTSSALDGSKDLAANNVGHEEYHYSFGAKNTSNVRVDEFVITDSLEYVTSQGYRMTTLWTGTTPPGMDYDGLCAILYKTNMTDPNTPVVYTYDYMAANPPNPNNPNNYMSQAIEPGWIIWKERVSTTTATRLDVADLNLREGEYITGLRIFYGGVVQGFYTGSAFGTHSGVTPRDWNYAVVATGALLTEDDMGNETVMKGSIEAGLFRNWNGSAPVLTDVDKDQVETRVIETFSFDRLDLELKPSDYLGTSLSTNTSSAIKPFKIPRTADGLWLAILKIAIVAFTGALCIFLGLKKKRGRRHSYER
ncbi:MAG: SpaA isopeptide-forming pilin-related protein [Coriobacteriia bacterium]|nr:SpaA isopeptide-forming pilin-related protein [Coriobacteriia bacterium]